MRTLSCAPRLLNLACCGGPRWIDGPPAPAARAALGAPAVAPLELAAAASTPGAAAPKRCRSIGPFADAAAAGAAAALLRLHGWQPRQRSVDATTPDGYWVYIADLRDSAAQRSAMARLNKAGIHDAATMTQADQMDRLSVGVFADQTHAVHRAEQVRQLGFKPILDVHQKTISEPWLDLELQPGESDPQPSEFQSAGAASTANPTSGPAADVSGGLRVVDCPAKGTSG